MEHKYFSGVDIAKSTFVVGFTHKKSTEKFKNNLEGFEKFKEAYQDILNETLIVLETTGRYEWAFLKFLVKNGYSVHRAHAARVKSYMKSLGQRGKTDPADAKALAQYAQERRDTLTIFKIPDEILEQLNILSHRKFDVKKMIHQEKNRLKSPENDIIKDSIEALLTSLEEVLNQIQIKIDLIFKENEVLSAKLCAAIEIPGIAEETGKMLISLIPELGTLTKAKIASLVGVAPHPKDSGAHSGYRSIPKGREEAKRTLYLSSMAASKSKSPLGDFYRGLKARGKKPKVALVALMRKILIILNAKIRDNCYEKII